MKDNTLYSIKPGQVVKIGKALYSRCAECDSLVRVNKPILGSLHLCSYQGGPVSSTSVKAVRGGK